MKTKIQILVCFLITFISNAQKNTITDFFKDCNNYSVEDSISLYDQYTDFTLKLPKYWTGKFRGDLNSLLAQKTSDSSFIKLEGYSAYDVQNNNNELQKKNPNFLDTIYIASQEIVIISHPKTKFKNKLLHKYEFHCKIENTPWIRKFYLVANKEPNKKNICEIRHIIKQYMQKFKS
ncbi:hypothetical protein [uncultured Tenacibaculum sp.]|uniref:hypothetical protein n=1 Tax=uncultured Tenacibaculum sp. TaxID=174713 RepID=UPI00261F6991|nr:hypothetical protein [uncultured Tenacibaculum sp.]